MNHFIQELHRRRVFRVCAAYAVLAFAAINALAGAAAYYALAPAWVTGAIILACALFPIVAVLSWFFDCTPWGVLRAQPRGTPPEPRTVFTDRRVEMILILLLLALLGVSVRGLFEEYAAQAEATPPSPGFHNVE
jgi:hypothetical protein